MADRPLADAPALTESDKLFAATPVGRLFVLTVIPGMLAMLLSSVYDVVDGVLVGQFLGEQCFAAVSLGIPFVIINFAFGDLIGVGSSVPISISLGRGDRDTANNIFTCSVIALVVSGAVLGGLLFAVAPLLMSLVGATGRLAELSCAYVRVYAVFSPVTTSLFAVDNYLKISGRMRRSLGVNVFMAVCGGILEFAFLAVLHKGILWTGLAYSLAMSAAVIVGFWPFFGGNLTLRFVRPRFSAELVGEVVRCGLSTFLDNVAGRIASILVNWALIAHGGEMAVSAYGVVMYVDMVVAPLLYGSLDAISPAIGYNWGSGRKDRVRGLQGICFCALAGISLLAIVVMNVFPRQLTHLFMLGASDELVAMAVQAIRVVSLINLTRWFVFCVQGLVVAIGKHRIASAVSVVRTLVFPAIAVAALWPFGLMGMWFVYPAACAVSAVFSAAILLHLRKELR